MGAGDTFDFYEYTGDDGKPYNVKLSAADAAAGGFGAATDPLDYPPWPWHERDLRHVTGYDTSNNDKHSRLVIATNSFALFTQGGTWNNANTGRSYTVQGAEGERRPANHLK